MSSLRPGYAKLNIFFVVHFAIICGLAVVRHQELVIGPPKCESCHSEELVEDQAQGRYSSKTGPKSCLN